MMGTYRMWLCTERLGRDLSPKVRMAVCTPFGTHSPWPVESFTWWTFLQNSSHFGPDMSARRALSAMLVPLARMTLVFQAMTKTSPAPTNM